MDEGSKKELILIRIYSNLGKYTIKDNKENNIRLKKVKNKNRFIPEIKINANQVIKIIIVCPMSG